MVAERQLLAVLILEESETVAKRIVRELVQAGFVVQSARVSTLAEFRAQLRRQRWDLVTSASAMADCKLEDALAEVKASEPEVPLIVVSAAGTATQIVEALRMGASGYVLKSKIGGLGAAVRRALREKSGQ